MVSWRHRRKDIKRGDQVQYRPLGMARTEQNADLFAAFGTVVGAEEFHTRMTVTVEWDTPGVPPVVDVNDVEVLARGG